jgi:hypothetical protein
LVMGNLNGWWLSLKVLVLVGVVDVGVREL